MFAAVVFDLDGTLLDTLADIANAANAVLEELGFPAHPMGAYRQFVGEGVIPLFLRALPSAARTEDVAQQCAAGFQPHYDRHWNVCTRAYEGIPETLAGLEQRGLRKAVLSNKPDLFTKKCVDQYLSDFDFPYVLGQRPEVPRKPDPTGALEIARLLKVTPEQCVYVGDTGIDMETAVRAGMFPVGVTWGFRPRQELEKAGAARMIESPKELLEIVDGRL